MVSNPSHINFELVYKNPGTPLVPGISYICKIKDMNIKTDVENRKYLTLVVDVENG